tara:strand:+ start:1373 stop:1630 length:258 start_codon:yes stop_codon:yes gene_type:complete
MNRLNWIVKELIKDTRKNYKWVLKGAGLVLATIAIIKVLMFFNIEKDVIFPIIWIVFIVGMVWHWYSMSYDNEQKKIVEQLKGDK